MSENKPLSKIMKLVRYIQRDITNLQKGYLSENPQSRARIAKLRRLVNKSLGDSPETWEVLAGGFPGDLMGTGYKPTLAEQIAFCTLALYATHQQSESLPMYISNSESEKVMIDGKYSLGSAVRKFVIARNQSIDELEKNPAFKRLANVINSHDLDDQITHLRGLIQLFKAEDIAIDYASLAWDLYNLHFSSTKKEVTLRWGRQLYRIQPSEKEPDQTIKKQ